MGTSCSRNFRQNGPELNEKKNVEKFFFFFFGVLQCVKLEEKNG